MGALDLVIAGIASLQPILLAFIIAATARMGVSLKFFFVNFDGARTRIRAVKFFECASHSRLVASARYDISSLLFCALFIIYDVDLLYFVFEVTVIDFISSFELSLIACNIFLFVAGLIYDQYRYGFH